MKQAENSKTMDMLETTKTGYVATLQRIKAILDNLDMLAHNTEQEMAALKTAGVKYATPHYRAGRYLYLIHPQKDGERVREYIGADPEKITAALDAINRAHQYDQLAETLKRDQQKTGSIQYYLDMAIKASGKNPYTW